MTNFKNFTIASSYVMRGKTVFVNSDGIFDIVPTKKKINANMITFGGRYPYVARGEDNNGIRGYINFDENFLNPANTISFGQDTATMNYQPIPYFTGDKIQIFKLNKKYGILTEKIALYLITSIKKAFSSFAWGQSSFALDVISYIKVPLPIDSKGNLDVLYMKNRITELEQDRIAELDAYLKATGLDDCELTNEDKKVLSKKVNIKGFVMHDIFEPLPVKKAVKANVRKYKDNEFCVPVVYAKFGDNGIMYWGRKNEFTTYSNVLSIVYNGVIAAGKCYAQEEETGILAESYLIRYKKGEVPFLANLYMSRAIEHKIYPLYSREKLAIWNNRVENDVIELPATSGGEPDFDYMARYIRAIEKLVIADVMKYKDKSIADARKIINEN